MWREEWIQSGAQHSWMWTCGHAAAKRRRSAAVSQKASTQMILPLLVRTGSVPLRRLRAVGHPPEVLKNWHSFISLCALWPSRFATAEVQFWQYFKQLLGAARLPDGRQHHACRAGVDGQA